MVQGTFFAPKFIRGKARKYGIQTDASQRFERGVDFNLQLKALEMASTLIIKYLGGSCTKAKEIISKFLDMIKEKDDINSDLLKSDEKIKLMSLGGVKNYPMRVKCATLAWNTLTQSFDEIQNLS